MELGAVARGSQAAAPQPSRRPSANPEAHNTEAHYVELNRLRKRGWLINACIALLTFCGLLIGLTILALFLGETTDLQIIQLTTLAFLSGLACFLLARLIPLNY